MTNQPSHAETYAHINNNNIVALLDLVIIHVAKRPLLCHSQRSTKLSFIRNISHLSGQEYIKVLNTRAINNAI